MFLPERQHALPAEFRGLALMHIALLVHEAMVGLIAVKLEFPFCRLQSGFAKASTFCGVMWSSMLA